MVFRMFQEIIKNIIKHAKAKSVEFIISKKDSLFEITFIDDGIGFEYSTNKPNENNGIGLAGLNSRAKHFNGSVIIKSILQKGTTISIFIPVSTVC
jgi:signal transduction histidine kinase